MVDSITPQQALLQAVHRMGSQAALARLVGVTQQAVSNWLDKGSELPAEHVLAVEAATHVSRHDLRPDIYPRGLQDGVPFTPDILELGQFEGLVADESDAKMQAGAGAAR